MDARERAQTIIDRWNITTIDAYMIRNDIEQAIIAAEDAKAKEEREACAKIVDYHGERLKQETEKARQKLAEINPGLARSAQVMFGQTVDHANEMVSLVAKTIASQIRARSEDEKKEKGD